MAFTVKKSSETAKNNSGFKPSIHAGFRGFTVIFFFFAPVYMRKKINKIKKLEKKTTKQQ